MAKRAMTPESKAEKANSILDKAAEMFSVLEYEKIKMSSIAKEMNLSNGILFVYFKTKESLFYTLLCREYLKRINWISELADRTEITSFQDFKEMILLELEELVDTNPLYVRLEAVRSAILEKNVDPEILLEQKTRLYESLQVLVKKLCNNGVLKEADVMNIFMSEISIITGCKLTASLPCAVVELIEENRMNGFVRDFKRDVLSIMKNYLDGYHLV